MRYNNIRRLERYSNGKEPHWKCGVPQGIVRSSRILSASTRITEVIRVFLLSALLFDNADYILLITQTIYYYIVKRRKSNMPKRLNLEEYT